MSRCQGDDNQQFRGLDLRALTKRNLLICCRPPMPCTKNLCRIPIIPTLATLFEEHREDPLSDRRGSSTLLAESSSRLRVRPNGLAGHNVFLGKPLRRFGDLFCGRGRSGDRAHATSYGYRPTGECLEPKTLLSDVLGWNGGSGGTQNSLITPANISQLTQQYADVVDGAIVAEPLVASVDVTVGPDPGIQSLVFVATQLDSLYAFNAATGQLAWHTSFLVPGRTALTPSEIDFQGSGIIGTPVIDPAH